MKNNRGFSLIELIVAVTIASGVGVAVFGFMVVGAKAFGSSSADVNVQHEAQLVFNQMQELIVDTNIGIESDEQTVEDGMVVKTLTMYNYDPEDPGKHVYEVQWDERTGEVSYSEYLPVLDASSGEETVGKADPPLYRNQLMGENITEFDVDLSAMETKRVVRLNMTLQKGRTTYKSSHNITLRNRIIKGSTIPEYIENTPSTVDPEKVVGPENLFVEPGQVIEMQLAGGYKVKAPDGSDYPDQDIRFFISNDGSYDAGTNVSTSGTLTVSKAQKTDFYVTVATRTGRGTALRVKINMIIVDSVDVKIIARDDEKELGDPMGRKTSFTLEATVNGRNLDKSTNHMYGITWALAPGTDAYVDMGAASATAKGSTCNFSMKQDLAIDTQDGTAPFEITATSVRSTQVPYYTGANRVPVVGTYRGIASSDKGDFTISSKGSLLRGKHSNESWVEIVSNLASVIDNYDARDYVVFAGIKVNEYVYQQEEKTPSTKYILKKDVRNSASTFQGEGTNLGIWAPEVSKANPNSAFEYEVTYYLFKRHEGDSTNEGTIRVFKPGETVVEGYDINKADYRSNVVSQFCDRLFVYYNGFGDGIKQWSNGEKNLTASFTPRALGNDGPDSLSSDQQYTFTLGQSSNVEDNGIINAIQNDGGFKIYYQKDGTWVEYDDSRRIHANSAKYSNLTQIIKELNQALLIKYDSKKWDDELPSMVRIVPYLIYEEDGQQKEGVLFDNYINVYLWNIELPVIGNYKTGTRAGGGYVSRGFLPSPEDPAFAFMQGGEYHNWQNPYPPNVIGVSQTMSENDIKNLKLNYKITYNNDGNGVPTYYAQVRYLENGQRKTLAYYKCRKGDRYWEMISQEKVPGNLDFEK